MRTIGEMDVFLSKAAAEVIFMYTKDRPPFPDAIRLIKDTSASAAPVGRFYHGWYHTLVVAPATSNTVAKCVAGISDTLVTNVFAQAGKCRVPAIVYACDTKPVHDTMAPGGMVRLWPRRVDLENTERLKAFEATTVVEDMAELERGGGQRLAEVRCGHPHNGMCMACAWREELHSRPDGPRAGRVSVASAPAGRPDAMSEPAALGRPACPTTSSSVTGHLAERRLVGVLEAMAPVDHSAGRCAMSG